MRIVLAAAVVAATASLGLADGRTAATDTAALQTGAQHSVPLPAPADHTTLEPSFYGFWYTCTKHSEKSDTAKLLMN